MRNREREIPYSKRKLGLEERHMERERERVGRDSM